MQTKQINGHQPLVFSYAPTMYEKVTTNSITQSLSPQMNDTSNVLLNTLCSNVRSILASPAMA